MIDTISCPYHLTHVPTTATCTEGGKHEYYICNVCDWVYLNGDATDETAPDQIPTIGALGHILQRIPAKAPTYEHSGHIEHYRCTREGCGKLFADAEGKQELSANDVVLPKLVRTDTLPQTGDSSRPTAWLALLGACCAGLWYAGRRRG